MISTSPSTSFDNCSWRAQLGLNFPNEYKEKISGVRYEELYTVDWENYLRKLLKEPPRKTYASKEQIILPFGTWKVPKCNPEIRIPIAGLVTANDIARLKPPKRKRKDVPKKNANDPKDE